MFRTVVFQTAVLRFPARRTPVSQTPALRNLVLRIPTSPTLAHQFRILRDQNLRDPAFQIPVLQNLELRTLAIRNRQVPVPASRVVDIAHSVARGAVFVPKNAKLFFDRRNSFFDRRKLLG
jgi:hypothetical protein